MPARDVHLLMGTFGSRTPPNRSLYESWGRLYHIWCVQESNTGFGTAAVHAPNWRHTPNPPFPQPRDTQCCSFFLSDTALPKPSYQLLDEVHDQAEHSRPRLARHHWEQNAKDFPANQAFQAKAHDMQETVSLFNFSLTQTQLIASMPP